MAFETINEANVTTLAGVFTYTANVVPIFSSAFLMAIFFIATFGSYFASIRLSGRGTFLGSFAVAGYVTAVTSYFMMLVPDLINSITVVVTTTVAILATILLLMYKE